MGYRIADLVNGPFSETFKTREEAEVARHASVKDSFELNLEFGMDEEEAMEAAQDFFRIVDSSSGEEV